MNVVYLDLQINYLRRIGCWVLRSTAPFYVVKATVKGGVTCLS